MHPSTPRNITRCRSRPQSSASRPGSALASVEPGGGSGSSKWAWVRSAPARHGPLVHSRRCSPHLLCCSLKRETNTLSPSSERWATSVWHALWQNLFSARVKSWRWSTKLRMLMRSSALHAPALPSRTAPCSESVPRMLPAFSFSTQVNCAAASDRQQQPAPHVDVTVRYVPVQLRPASSHGVCCSVTSTKSDPRSPSLLPGVAWRAAAGCLTVAAPSSFAFASDVSLDTSARPWPFEDEPSIWTESGARGASLKFPSACTLSSTAPVSEKTVTTALKVPGNRIHSGRLIVAVHGPLATGHPPT